MGVQLLLWDQLDENLLLDMPIVMVESYHDCIRHPHHKKKLVFLLSAMRHFYEKHKDKHNIRYIMTEKSIPEVIAEYSEVHMVRPGEKWYIEEVRPILHEDSRFISDVSQFKPCIMEQFYRNMRKKTGLLMQDGKPIGGKWNFDKANRKKMPDNIDPPGIPSFEPDQITLDVIDLVEKKFPNNFGSIYPMWLAVTQEDAQAAFSQFIAKALPQFGLYQDAMRYDSNPFLFHSGISAYLNIGLLNPMAVCKAVEAEYEAGRVSIESAEGYIRQIIGWREYIRNIYWNNDLNQNYLNYTEDLPAFYWTCDTDMACMKTALIHTRDYAYSHHIQRLMVTGNWAALNGVRPEEISAWYLGVYADAHEWVELPNTVGMATYADGGIVGTKPYIASANYINKMSNFCKNCKYDYKSTTGPNACPFNSLYWKFLAKHQSKLRQNNRMSLAYSILDNMYSNLT